MSDTELERLARIETKLDNALREIEQIKLGQSTGCSFGRTQADRIGRCEQEIKSMKRAVWAVVLLAVAAFLEWALPIVAKMFGQ